MQDRIRDHIFFDLDGTLTDPGLGITNSVAYALSKFGITVNDRRELYVFIGPPLFDSFSGIYGMGSDDANLAVAYYREYFAPKGLYENEVYEGIPEMLSKLKESGKKLVLATSKPEKFAVEILRHFGLDGYFDHICGATMDAERNKKDDVIKYALGLSGADPERSVMVGDRSYDVLGGKKFGLYTVGVTFGYGSERELSESGADSIAKSVKELENILINI